MPPLHPPSNRHHVAPPRGKASVRNVVRATLRSAVHSHSNRRRARELAWEWVGAKWPRLLPSANEIENAQFERSAPGQALSVATSGDGAVWTLSVAHHERGGTRTWMTRAMVADTGDADMLDLQTSCSDLPDAPLVVAPPRLLGLWVERLDLRDGGLPVQSEPRDVDDEARLAAFCDHVLADTRTLPVIALTHNPRSRFYGVDPRGLAEAVRGLAHVACLAPDMAAEAAMRLGKDFCPVPGAARIYAPGFGLDALPQDHPLIRDSSVRAEDPGAFRRLLCRKVCALSVVAPMDAAILRPQ